MTGICHRQEFLTIALRAIVMAPITLSIIWWSSWGNGWQDFPPLANVILRFRIITDGLWPARIRSWVNTIPI